MFFNLRSYLHTNTSVYKEGNSHISSNTMYINTAHRLLGSNQYLESIQKLTILVTLFSPLEHTCTQMMISPPSWRVAHTQAFQCKQKEVAWRHNCYTCARTRRPPYLGIYDKPTTSHAFCCRMYTVYQLWLTSSKRAKNVKITSSTRTQLPDMKTASRKLALVDDFSLFKDETYNQFPNFKP